MMSLADSASVSRHGSREDETLCVSEGGGLGLCGGEGIDWREMDGLRNDGFSTVKGVLTDCKQYKKKSLKEKHEIWPCVVTAVVNVIAV